MLEHTGLTSFLGLRSIWRLLPRFFEQRECLSARSLSRNRPAFLGEIKMHLEN